MEENLQKKDPNLESPSKKQKLHGGVLALVGYLLSPLSWWNDALVNIPIAYLFALPFGLISEKIFLPAMIIGYWLTNIIGLLLISHGTLKIIDHNHEHLKRSFLKNIIIATIYTALIFLLAKINFLSFPDLAYFVKK